MIRRLPDSGTGGKQSPLAKLSEHKKHANCDTCPLQKLHFFRKFSEPELVFVNDFKTGELTVNKGSSILVEGSHNAHLYTVLSGWSFRYKLLEDGRRQVLNYMLPGDLIGLQGSVMGESEHSIEALTDVTLCVFERSRVMELFSKFPELGYDLTWIAAHEERILDEHLLSVGRRTALERSAYLLAFLHERAQAILNENKGKGQSLPITQQLVADTLGLSTVHTNKTLRKLARKGLIEWLDRGCDILEPQELARVAGWEAGIVSGRPYI